MDFFRVRERSSKAGVVEVFPDYRVCRSKDLMVRGRSFYAIWDEGAGLWSTDEYAVQRLVDNKLWDHKKELDKRSEGVVQVKLLSDFSSSSWLQFRNYIGHLSDSSSQLDEDLVFSNTEVKKTDYVSRRLPYPLAPGDISSWDEIIGTLYNPDERAKLEWAIGAIVAGDAKKIQKFIVLYGKPGSGKGTILNIIQDLFQGYWVMFDAKAITASGNQFSTEVFKSNPLVAIQHDGDLSRIEDNSKLNSIVSHETMTMNEKYKPSYDAKVNAFLFLGTNKPVKITDAKSGLMRRLIDVHPSNNLIPPRRYQTLMAQVDFELGAIAHHCLEVYRGMGKHYYSDYRPVEMMLQTDIFFNFVQSHYDIFKEQDGVSLNQAWELYNQFVTDSGLEHSIAKHKLREELKNYFNDFDERTTVGDTRIRNWFSGFQHEVHFKTPVVGQKEEHAYTLVMEETTSLIDAELASNPAQYSKDDGHPAKFWTDEPRRDQKTGEMYIPSPKWVCDTTLADLDTSREHFVKAPLNHIVIDFDLTGPDGNKSAERNLEAASQWPPTYAEYSKSGNGIHLHYIYDGDVNTLSRVYDDGIEIKIFNGNSSLRRRLSKCNNIPVAHLNSGLPIKEKKVMNSTTVQSERSLRAMIDKNIRKEVHAGTKPSMDFIHKILDEAYYSGLEYDLTDMRSALMAFAANSTNQSDYCVKLFMDLKFKSEEVSPNPVSNVDMEIKSKTRPIAFFDVEVFPNLFVVCYKIQGAGNKVVRMINPTPQQIEELLDLRLVGFNNRRYDNHILYGRLMGYTNEQLYKLSQKIISNTPNALFGEAYNLSYADIYDFSSLKQGLKKFQIMLGIHHQELGLPWDQPVPEELWELVCQYCDNDVLSTEAVFDSRKEDYMARQILASLSGLQVNDTTQKHTSKIVFGDDRRPQEKFVYTDLSEMFPGYKYEFGASTYRGEVAGEGGYVFAKPGIYYDVALLDVASMHPTSIEELELFGEYTKNFSALKDARMAIKHKDYDAARFMLNGKLAPFLDDPKEAEALSYALKIVINIVYGLTAAKFDNSFKDPRNIDNIVAKRGALFMIDLKHFVQDLGFEVAHIKTDSIKIPGATPDIIQAVMEFGKDYGYTFEHEATYSKFCLVNQAVYVARVGWAEKESKIGTWEPTGAQFKHPFVYKTLFTKEQINFDDKCETKNVTTALYLDFTDLDSPLHAAEENLHFVGKAGRFCPIIPGGGGGLLVREKEGKYYAAVGSSGYFWLEAEVVQQLGKENMIDMAYFRNLADEAIAQINKFGDYEQFVAV